MLEMQFKLSEERESLRKRVRELVQGKLAPGVGEREGKGEFPWDIVDLMRQHDLFAVWVPKEYGGVDVGAFERCLVSEELSKAANDASAIFEVIGLGATPIGHFGNDQQKAKYLPALVRGDMLCAYALTEPSAGSDIASMQATAILDGEEYIVNGTKCFITMADVANFIIVFAKTDITKGARGISALILDLGHQRRAPGFSISRVERKMSMQDAHTCEFALQDVRIPKGNLLGEEGQGFAIALDALDQGRLLVGAQGIGIAEGALDYAIDYMKKRVQFGKPLASFQALRFMVADMVMEIEAARQLVYAAATHYDERGPNTTVYGAIAKAFATDTAMKVTTNAVQLLGGYGATMDYPVERLMRAAKVTQIYEGTNEIQRLIIARSVLGK